MSRSHDICRPEISLDCISCCHLCTSSRPQPGGTSEAKNPYALDNLLPAGTLALDLDHDVPCNHTHSEDAWHPFEGSLFKECLSTDSELCRDIAFLTEHRFIAVTYRLGSSMDVILRVYLIPHDLANVKGQLRNRKKEILGPARRSLRKMLPRLVQDQTSWLEGSIPPKFSPHLIPNTKVPISCCHPLYF